MLWYGIVFATNNFEVELLGGFIFEGEEPSDHNVEYDAHRPHISFKPIVRVPRHHLRRSVAGTPTGCLEVISSHLVVVG